MLGIDVLVALGFRVSGFQGLGCPGRAIGLFVFETRFVSARPGEGQRTYGVVGV